MAFNLPVLQTNYEKIQAIPQGGFGKGLESLTEAAKTVTEYGEWNKADKKKKELEAILNASKTDNDKLDGLMKLSSQLQAELEAAKKAEADNIMKPGDNPDIKGILGGIKDRYTIPENKPTYNAPYNQVPMGDYPLGLNKDLASVNTFKLPSLRGV